MRANRRLHQLTFLGHRLPHRFLGQRLELVGSILKTTAEFAENRTSMMHLQELGIDGAWITKALSFVPRNTWGTWNMRVILALVALFSAGFAYAAEIAIDTGHTLAKPGTISASGVTEFDFNRKFVLALERHLRTVGVTTHVINDSGRIGSLIERTTLAKMDRLFISIHHDSVKQRYRPVKDPRFKGYSLWVSQQNADFQESVRCAKLIAEQMLAAGFQPSHYHADAIYGESRPVVDWDRGIFTNNRLAVLATARGPAILIEVGVIANPSEEAVLRDSAVTETQAHAIAIGLQQCIAG